MSSRYDADRRDPKVKRLEREGLNALLQKLHAQSVAQPQTAA